MSNGPMDVTALATAIDDREVRESATIDHVSLQRNTILDNIGTCINMSPFAKANNVVAWLTPMIYSKGVWYAGNLILKTIDGKDPITVRDVTIQPMTHRSGYREGKLTGKWYIIAVTGTNTDKPKKITSDVFGNFADLTDIADTIVRWVLNTRQRRLDEIVRRENIDVVSEFKTSITFSTKQRVMDIFASSSPEAPFFVKLNLQRAMTEHDLRVLLITLNGLNLLKE